MFNALFAEETGHTNQEKDEGAASTSTAEASGSGAANPLLSFWSVATAVTNTVKARADELVKSVVDTDWKSELSQFSREVGEESKTLKEKTAEVVQNLPEQVVHLPEKAEEALQHLPTPVQLPKDVGQTLEGVSVALSTFGKSLLLGTKELIDELKEGVETEIAAASREGKRSARSKAAVASAGKLSSVQAKYNRFEAEVAAMQRDSSTYCDEPEDAEDYARWRAGFSLDGVKADIARIVAENAFMAELQSRLVPIIVEHDDFWRRYFYRLHKLQQKEEQRQQLAQRAKTLQEDDVPLGWGDEDEAPPSASPSGQQTAAAAPAPSDAAPASTVGEPEEQPAPAPEPVDEPAVEASSAAMGDTALAPAAEEQPSEPAAQPASSVGKAEAPTVEGPAVAESSPAQPAVELPVPGSKAQSGGGASEPGSTSAHVDTDGSQLEAEPHVETASDSSTKEWCVVTAGGQPSSSGGAPPPATAGSGAAVQPENPALQPEPSGEAPAVGTKAEEPAAAPSTPSESQAKAASAAATAKAAAPAAARSGPAAAKKLVDEEDVDEDWGNWD